MMHRDSLSDCIPSVKLVVPLSVPMADGVVGMRKLSGQHISRCSVRCGQKILLGFPGWTPEDRVKVSCGRV